MSHTEGKLSHAYRKRHDGWYAEEIFDSSGELVATAAWYPVKIEGGFTTNREANARRLVACWNAMEGIDDPEMWVMQMQYMDGHFGTLLDERDDLVKERDELVAVIRSAQKAFEQGIKSDFSNILAKYPEAS